MDTITRPPCTAQHTDDLNTWACTSHLGDYHLHEVDGVVVRMWRDPDQPATADPYDELVAAVEVLVARLRGRATDPATRGVVDAYDRLVNPGTGVSA